MFTISASEISSEYKIKGSRFYGYLYSVSTLKEIDHYLTLLKNHFPDATHHCYAWRLDPDHPEEFANDDGEPSGSAGLPILNVLRSQDLINILAVVIRYYGGTKLGKSGLIESYGETIKSCTNELKKHSIKKYLHLTFNYNYNIQSLIGKFLNQFNAITLHSNYLQYITLDILILAKHAKEATAYLENLSYLDVKIDTINIEWHPDIDKEIGK